MSVLDQNDGISKDQVKVRNLILVNITSSVMFLDIDIAAKANFVKVKNITFRELAQTKNIKSQNDVTKNMFGTSVVIETYAWIDFLDMINSLFEVIADDQIYFSKQEKYFILNAILSSFNASDIKHPRMYKVMVDEFRPTSQMNSNAITNHVETHYDKEGM